MHRADETMMVRMLMFLSGVSLALQQDMWKADMEAMCFSVSNCMPSVLPSGDHVELCRVFEDAVTCMQGSVEACRQLDFPAEQLAMSELKIKELRQNLDSHCAGHMSESGFDISKSSERTDDDLEGFDFSKYADHTDDYLYGFDFSKPPERTYGMGMDSSTSGHRAVLGAGGATPEPYGDSTMDSGAATAATASFPFALLRLITPSLVSFLFVTVFFSSSVMSLS